MKGALRPEALGVVDAWRIDEVSKKTGVNVEDETYANLASHAGWKQLKEFMESMKDSLDRRLSQSVLSGLDAEIRKDALFCVLGKDLLNSIIHRVEDSREVVDQINNEREQQRKKGNGGS